MLANTDGDHQQKVKADACIIRRPEITHYHLSYTVGLYASWTSPVHEPSIEHIATSVPNTLFRSFFDVWNVFPIVFNLFHTVHKLTPFAKRQFHNLIVLNLNLNLLLKVLCNVIAMLSGRS